MAARWSIRPGSRRLHIAIVVRRYPVAAGEVEGWLTDLSDLRVAMMEEFHQLYAYRVSITGRSRIVCRTEVKPSLVLMAY